MATQTAYNYGLLPEQAQEDALHATRLMNIEERPFHRVTRALLARDSPIKQLPLNDKQQQQTSTSTSASKRAQFRTDILLDFAALESSIVRMQLTQTSHARERQRYAAEKAKILHTAQAVRANTLELRAQLEEARRVLVRRKGYDELAARILDDNRVKGREEGKAECERLSREIEELEAESHGYEGLWRGRREGFERVVAEGEGLERLIRGIKESVEVGGEDLEGGDESGQGTKGQGSVVGTPGPEGRTPRVDTEAGTPALDVGEGNTGGATTPARRSNRFLDVEGATTSNSRTASPSRLAEAAQSDVEMAETDAEVVVSRLISTPAGVESAEGIAETMDET